MAILGNLTEQEVGQFTRRLMALQGVRSVSSSYSSFGPEGRSFLLTWSENGGGGSAATVAEAEAAIERITRWNAALDALGQLPQIQQIGIWGFAAETAFITIAVPPGTPEGEGENQDTQTFTVCGPEQAEAMAAQLPPAALRGLP